MTNASYAIRAFGSTITYTPVVVPTTPTSYAVSIDGINYMALAGSVSVDSTIGKRSQASFMLRTTTATHFQQYQKVRISDQNNNLVFSGYITKPKEQKPGFRNSLLHTITCCDQHFLADKRVMAASYTNKTVGEIVDNIVTNILSAEGVTVGQIYDGIPPNTNLYPNTTLYPGGNVGLVPSATFVYATVAQALDALVQEASAAGVPYYWMIDQNKKMWFVPYTAVINNTVVDGSQIDMVRTPPYVSRQNPTYRNTQYIVGGVAQTVPQTETRIGDANTTAWTMGYDLATAPTITVSSTGKTVGIKGLDTNKDFYWQQGSPIITQDSAATKLTSSQTLQVVYIGQYPTVIISSNQAQITYEQNLDATTGIIEQVDTDNTITSINNGLDKASQLLTRYATQGTMLQFTTRTSGFAPGQLITVNLLPFNLVNAQMLIENVHVDDQLDGYNLWYTITAVLGPYDVGWIDFFSKLLLQQAPANSVNVGVGQSVNILVSFTSTLTPTATLNPSVYACPLPNTGLYPQASGLYPC